MTVTLCNARVPYACNLRMSSPTLRMAMNMSWSLTQQTRRTGCRKGTKHLVHGSRAEERGGVNPADEVKQGVGAQVPQKGREDRAPVLQRHHATNTDTRASVCRTILLLLYYFVLSLCVYYSTVSSGTALVSVTTTPYSESSLESVFGDERSPRIACFDSVNGRYPGRILPLQYTSCICVSLPPPLSLPKWCNIPFGTTYSGSVVNKICLHSLEHFR